MVLFFVAFDVHNNSVNHIKLIAAVEAKSTFWYLELAKIME